MAVNHYYSDEANTQILVALLKAHDIRHIVISPGATNDCFIMSVQGDSFFTLYSAVDERHAGYLACGIAQELGCPVVINCTGATASRNYMPPLTEAFYRKLPIVAVTCSQHSSHLGHMYPQITDRMHLPYDIVCMSVQCPIPHTHEEYHACELNINNVLLETKRHGGGPVHVNLETAYSGSYRCKELPPVVKISRNFQSEEESWPVIPRNAKVVVWIGAHRPFANDELDALNQFAESCDAVVLTDATSNYVGTHAVRSALICSQYAADKCSDIMALKPDLIIHIGEISGDYYTMKWLCNKSTVWRVNEDGELKDRLGRLDNVFESNEKVFFVHYAKAGKSVSNGCNYVKQWKDVDDMLRQRLPDLPYSHLWIATSMVKHIPSDAVLHFGILNALRCWNMNSALNFRVYCTTGGFGIDGGTSSMIGSSLASPDRLHIGVFGDLAFFYDLNALGSRHIQKNIRIIVVNNNEGGEFSVPRSMIDNPICGERVHDYIAARGHFGGAESSAIEHIADAFGFEYFAARSKEEFDAQISEFMSEQVGPAIFECVVETQSDREALHRYYSIIPDVVDNQQKSMSSIVRAVVPRRIKNVVKAAIGK